MEAHGDNQGREVLKINGDYKFARSVVKRECWIGVRNAGSAGSRPCVSTPRGRRHMLQTREIDFSSEYSPLPLQGAANRAQSLFTYHMQWGWVGLTNELQKIGVRKQRVTVRLRPFGFVGFGVINDNVQIHVAEIDAFETFSNKQCI